MSATQKLADTLAAIGEQSKETTNRIAAVLLHARARQMKSQTRARTMAAVLIGIPVGIVLKLIAFVIYPFTNTLKFIACAVVAAISYYASPTFDIQSWQGAVLGYLLCHLFVEVKETQDLLRTFLFDTLDIISFGSLTKAYATFVINSGRSGCELLLQGKDTWYTPQSWATKFYVTRHPYYPVRELQAIEDRFLDLAEQRESEEAVKEACDEYWNKCA